LHQQISQRGLIGTPLLRYRNAKTNKKMEKQIEKPRVQINYLQLLALLMSIKGQTFEGIVLFTKSVLSGGKKTEALFNGGVYKMARYVFCANREYLRALELLCGKMGIDFSNFKPQPHNYANVKMGGSVICHDSDTDLPVEQKRLYNQFIFHDGASIEAHYFDGNMQPLTFDQVKPYLPNRDSKKQAEQLGLEKENQIKIINPSLRSIREVRVNGVIYEVVED
jgi:hypothetical protein